MDTAEILVVIIGTLLIVATLWFFFGKREAVAASRTESGVQEVDVLVKGGYSPDRIQVEAGRPVQLKFYRDETTSCTEQVILSDFAIARELPYQKTTVLEFTPEEPGEFVFHCGMNMVRGTLVVKRADRSV
jgi:plastocyanin domain-containing protein